jgi:hypothetical protein
MIPKLGATVLELLAELGYCVGKASVSTRS